MGVESTTGFFIYDFYVNCFDAFLKSSSIDGYAFLPGLIKGLAMSPFLLMMMLIPLAFIGYIIYWMLTAWASKIEI